MSYCHGEMSVVHAPVCPSAFYVNRFSHSSQPILVLFMISVTLEPEPAMMEADNNHNFTLYSHIIFNIKKNKININRKKYVTKRDHCLTISNSPN